MKPQFQYSIVYGLLNLATTERLSVGIIYVNNGEIKFKYSRKKMDALKLIMDSSEHSFLSRVVKNMDKTSKKESPDLSDSRLELLKNIAIGHSKARRRAELRQAAQEWAEQAKQGQTGADLMESVSTADTAVKADLGQTGPT